VKRLRRDELPIDTETLARFLLGKVVVRETPDGVISGRIVETEAYIVGDAASHTFRGPTPRTRPMFLERGHAYVYLNYGVSWMLNVSSEAAGIGAGVLIRALEPLEGIALMQTHRGTEKLRDLARGPGRLTQALQIGPWADGLDLCAEGPLWLAHDDHEPADIGPNNIGCGVRIGITKDADRPLRFYLRGSPFLSGTRALNV
jgi:DNA-3-methyladenine glycosylase